MQMHKLRLFYIAMPTTSSIKGKQLPAHSVSFEIYTGIARFPCDSMALVLHWHQSKTLKRYCMLSKMQYLRYDAESTLLRIYVSKLTSSKSSLPRGILSRNEKAQLSPTSWRLHTMMFPQASHGQKPRCKGRNQHKRTSWKLVGSPGRELVAN